MPWLPPGGAISRPTANPTPKMCLECRQINLSDQMVGDYCAPCHGRVNLRIPDFTTSPTANSPALSPVGSLGGQHSPPAPMRLRGGLESPNSTFSYSTHLSSRAMPNSPYQDALPLSPVGSLGGQHSPPAPMRSRGGLESPNSTFSYSTHLSSRAMPNSPYQDALPLSPVGSLGGQHSPPAPMRLIQADLCLVCNQRLADPEFGPNALGSTASIRICAHSRVHQNCYATMRSNGVQCLTCRLPVRS